VVGHGGLVFVSSYFSLLEFRARLQAHLCEQLTGARALVLVVPGQSPSGPGRARPAVWRCRLQSRCIILNMINPPSTPPSPPALAAVAAMAASPARRILLNGASLARPRTTDRSPPGTAQIHRPLSPHHNITTHHSPRTFPRTNPNTPGLAPFGSTCALAAVHCPRYHCTYL
jgi:hypothetical protein